MSLSGYGQHALDLRGMGRLFVGGILEEGADGGQPQIAAAGCDSSALFQVIQKCRNQGCINRLESQTGRRLVQTLLSALQQQTKSIPIGTDGVWAYLPLIYQALGEELLQQRGQRGCGPHDCFSQ